MEFIWKIETLKPSKSRNLVNPKMAWYNGIQSNERIVIPKLIKSIDSHLKMAY
jgi:hypothetical protein